MEKKKERRVCRCKRCRSEHANFLLSNFSLFLSLSPKTVTLCVSHTRCAQTDLIFFFFFYFTHHFFISLLNFNFFFIRWTRKTRISNFKSAQHRLARWPAVITAPSSYDLIIPFFFIPYLSYVYRLSLFTSVAGEQISPIKNGSLFSLPSFF